MEFGILGPLLVRRDGRELPIGAAKQRALLTLLLLGRGELVATPAPVNSSGDFAGLVGTDGFVELPAGQEEFPAGYVAPFRPWV